MDNLNLDDDLDLLDDELDMGLPPAGGMFGKPMVPQAPQEPEVDDGSRKIQRNGSFDIKQVPGPDGKTYQSIDDGFMIIKEKIGQGSFCQVRRVTITVNLDKKNPETGEVYKEKGEQQLAVKVFNKKQLKNQKTNDYDKKTGMLKMSDQLQTIYEEIKVWQRVAHKNVAKIFELFDDPTIDKMYLMMELANHGQIQEALDAAGENFKRNEAIYAIAVQKCKILWPAEQDAATDEVELAAKWIFYQVTEGMQHLHDEMSICHRDLKHENIIMGRLNAGPRSEHERQPTIKVCDFTTAQIIDKPKEGEEPQKVMINAGTLAFNSPEQFTDDSYLPFPLDVWAFGITLFVYLTNSLPFKANDEHELEKVIVGTNYEELIDQQIASKFSAKLVNLMKSILKVNPKERLSFSEIIKHPWFEGRVEEKLNEEFDYLDM